MRLCRWAATSEKFSNVPPLATFPPSSVLLFFFCSCPPPSFLVHPAESSTSKKKKRRASIKSQAAAIARLSEKERTTYKSCKGKAVPVFSPSLHGIHCTCCSVPPFQPNHLSAHTATKKHQSYLAKGFAQPTVSGAMTALADASMLDKLDLEYRKDLVEALVSNGLPMSAADQLAHFLQKWVDNRKGLPHSNNLALTYVPIIAREQLDKVKAAVQGKLVWFAVDGTSRFSKEIMVLIARFMERGRWRQMVCDVSFFEVGLKEAEFAGEISSYLINAILSTLSVIGDDVVGFTYDRAAPNISCFDGPVIKCVFKSTALNVGCFSHTLSHAAERVAVLLPTLALFWAALMGSLTHSLKNKRTYHSCLQRTYPKWSRTRWLGKRDAQVGIEGDVDPIAKYALEASRGDQAEANKTHLADLRNMICPEAWLTEAEKKTGRGTRHLLRLELAILHNVTSAPHRAVYDLEGDYPLAHATFDVVTRLKRDFDTYTKSASFGALPEFFNNKENIAAAKEILGEGADDVMARSSMVALASSCAEECKEYLTSHFFKGDTDLTRGLEMYKHARLVDPDYVKGLSDIASMETLNSAIAHFNLNFVLADKVGESRPTARELREEFSAYRHDSGKTDFGAVSVKENCKMVEDFWVSRSVQCNYPSWCKLAQQMFLLQPSSASAERAFSALKRLLKTMRQTEQTVRAALMAACNVPRRVGVERAAYEGSGEETSDSDTDGGEDEDDSGDDSGDD